MRDRAFTLLLIAVGVALGAVREFLFVNLNYQLDHVRRGTPFSYAHSLFRSAVEGWSLNALTVAKWVLAFAFILLMLALAITLARILFGDHRYRPLLLGGVATLALLALLLHLLGGSWPALRAVAVKLLHALQYPVILLLIVLARPLAGTRRSVGAG